MLKHNPRFIIAIAAAAHEANRAYCIGIGDHGQPAWKDAPDWMRSSAIDGVENIVRNGAGPEASHENWLAEKARNGWTYGPVKDPEKKTHPCFVPYAELPPEAKVKDDVFCSVVRAVARELGLA